MFDLYITLVTVYRKRTWLSEDDVTVEYWTDRLFLCRKTFSRLPFLLFHPQPHMPIDTGGSMTDLTMNPLWPSLIFFY